MVGDVTGVEGCDDCGVVVVVTGLKRVKRFFNYKSITIISYGNLTYTGRCIKWDSKLRDSLSPIGATRENLETHKKWDSIFWDK